MPSLRTILASLAVAGSLVNAASWSFSDGKAIVSKKGAAARITEEFSPKTPLPEIKLAESESLKLALTLRNSEGTARPHQAMLLVQSGDSDLETFYTLAVKGISGKARVEVPYQSLPSAFLSSSKPLKLSVALGGFTTDSAALIPIGTLAPAKPEVARPTPVVYAPRPEITHTFRPDARSPPKILTLVFTLAVVATVGVLFGAWAFLGANVKALPKALKAAPASYITFAASLAALEGAFFMYYVKWNLFQMLPVAAAVAVVAVFSGRGAFSEVKARRLRGER